MRSVPKHHITEIKITRHVIKESCDFMEGSSSLYVITLPGLVAIGTQFARIHTSSLIKIEKTLYRPITKVYNGDDVNVIAAELRLTETRPTSFNKKRNL